MGFNGFKTFWTVRQKRVNWGGTVFRVSKPGTLSDYAYSPMSSSCGR
jgi:hypothetical protein